MNEIYSGLPPIFTIIIFYERFKVMEQMEKCVDKATLPPGLSNGTERGHRLTEIDEAHEEKQSGCSC